MDVLAVLDEYQIVGKLVDNEFLTLCPFHHDTHPSCSINIEKEVFRCLSCDAHGDLYSFLAAVNNVSRTAILKHLSVGTEAPATLSLINITNWHKLLKDSPKSLHSLKLKGITKKTIEDRLIGFDGTRVTFPIFDKAGNPVNVRKWKPGARKKKMISMKGHGTLHLYPLNQLDSSVLFITEGELKSLLLIQEDFPSLSSTGGSGSWQDEWSSQFKGKTIYLVFDIDNAGKRGALKAAKSLFKHTQEIYIITLDLDKQKYPSGDVTDYFIKAGKTKTDFRKLIKTAKKWEPLIYKETFEDDNTIHKVELSESSNAKYFNRLIETKVIVSAKDMAPYLVPYRLKVICPKDQDSCAFCNCFKQDEFKIDKKHPILLELINVSTERQMRALKKALSIPRNCTTCHFKVLESMNIEEIRLIPQIAISQEGTQHVTRQGFYIGHGIETNANYVIHARVCAQPDTQYAVLIIYNAEPAIDNLTVFELKYDLKIFQPNHWTVESIAKKLEQLYLDFEHNVTRIYKRPNLHLVYDLCYHSVLYIPFQDQIIKGWIEGLVLGDSGQGKTETIKQLQKHYKLGERIDVKSSSAVGLTGGLQETARRWFITWGIIPLNDRRLVVLEEIKGIPPESIAKLTEMRSSGIAEISKVEKARTNARVRLIWISNPRGDRQVLSFNFGVQAIKDLIGNLEDIRRFDIAIVVTVSDVDQKWINLSIADRKKVPHVFNSELCQQLVLWSWSRKHQDIFIQPNAVTEILRSASVMSKKYSSKIPLVEAADQRIKLARLATALAARTFSTEDNVKLIVRKCHVEYVSKFLDILYSSPACGYQDYSNLVKRETSVTDEEALIKHIRQLPYVKSVIETFLDTKMFTVFDIMDWTEMEVDECRKLVGILVRTNAIKRFSRGYVKNPAFITILKRLKMETLTNETRYDKLTKEDF